MRTRLKHFDSQQENDLIARYAKALSHPVRLQILRYLDKQSCCFTGDIVDIFPLAQSTVSQHLKELKDAGLIQGEVTPPKVKYCIDVENWRKAQTLFDDFFNQIQGDIKSCEL